MVKKKAEGTNAPGDGRERAHELSWGALETNSMDFPGPHSAAWLDPSVPRKGGVAL